MFGTTHRGDNGEGLVTRVKDGEEALAVKAELNRWVQGMFIR